MKRHCYKASTMLAAISVLSLAGLSQARAQTELINNGGFELNGGAGNTTFASWNVANTDAGSFYVQTGNTSPSNNFGVAAPPEGSFAAMTDQSGPGGHVLYQDFFVPLALNSATLSFDRYINNRNNTFFSPDTLSTGDGPNQQARIDILTSGSDPFSVAGSDVLMNLFQTQPGDPSVFGYTFQQTDISSLLMAHQGQTLRLRFAEADNQLYFNFGVDKVSLITTSNVTPEGSSLAMLSLGLLPLAYGFRRKLRKA